MNYCQPTTISPLSLKILSLPSIFGLFNNCFMIIFYIIFSIIISTNWPPGVSQRNTVFMASKPKKNVASVASFFKNFIRSSSIVTDYIAKKREATEELYVQCLPSEREGAPQKQLHNYWRFTYSCPGVTNTRTV